MVAMNCDYSVNINMIYISSVTLQVAIINIEYDVPCPHTFLFNCVCMLTVRLPVRFVKTL